MKKTLTLAFAACILLTGCPTKDLETPNITKKDDAVMCAPACAHIKSMGCPEGQPLVYPGTTCESNAECADGECIDGKCAETCEQVCRALVKEGRQLGLKCWQTITVCSEIESSCR